MWAIVVNPISGGGNGAIRGKEVAGYFASQDLDYTIITATSAQKLRANLDNFLDLPEGRQCQGVIAVGGDGLAHLVIQSVAPRKIPFTVIPAGTGNDLVRALGWSLDSINEQLNFVTTTRPTPLDLGMVDSEWFGAILSTGFDSVVNERANAMTWPKGPMKYNVAIALELPKFSPVQYTIELDTQLLQVEAMLIAVANGKSYGGGMQVCPNASMTDGLFDVMILHPVSKVEFIKVFPKVFKGAHIDHPQVRIYRSAKVSISSSAVAYADGERIGGLPVRAECMAGAGLSWTP
ncbi:LCB5 Sphingosine kinase and enzymes related to eukaryotic diacylglycerol kinase [Candidatus Nanopelagicaceae bacterium]